VGEAELGENRAGSGEAEALYQILPENPLGHGVEQEGRCPAKRITHPRGRA
jgi:hypothetical protein